jgi:hypothetical protein
MGMNIVNVITLLMLLRYYYYLLFEGCLELYVGFYYFSLFLEKIGLFSILMLLYVHFCYFIFVIAVHDDLCYLRHC